MRSWVVVHSLAVSLSFYCRARCNSIRKLTTVPTASARHACAATSTGISDTGDQRPQRCAGATGALHLAVMRGHASTAIALLKAGIVALEEVDAYGRTAWDVACMHPWSFSRNAAVFNRTFEVCPAHRAVTAAARTADGGGWQGQQSQKEATTCGGPVGHMMEGVSPMSADDFMERFVSIQRPVVIQQALVGSGSVRQSEGFLELRRRWAFEQLLDTHGELEFEAVSIPYAQEVFGTVEPPNRSTLRKVLTNMRKFSSAMPESMHENGPPQYVFEKIRPGSPQAVLETDMLLARPNFTNGSFFAHAMHEFYVGAAGSGASLHTHDDAINTLVYGRSVNAQSAVAQACAWAGKQICARRAIWIRNQGVTYSHSCLFSLGSDGLLCFLPSAGSAGYILRSGSGRSFLGWSVPFILISSFEARCQPC